MCDYNREINSNACVVLFRCVLLQLDELLICPTAAAVVVCLKSIAGVALVVVVAAVGCCVVLSEFRLQSKRDSQSRQGKGCSPGRSRF